MLFLCTYLLQEWWQQDLWSFPAQLRWQKACWTQAHPSWSTSTNWLLRICLCWWLQWRNLCWQKMGHHHWSLPIPATEDLHLQAWAIHCWEENAHDPLSILVPPTKPHIQTWWEHIQLISQLKSSHPWSFPWRNCCCCCCSGTNSWSRQFLVQLLAFSSKEFEDPTCNSHNEDVVRRGQKNWGTRENYGVV